MERETVGSKSKLEITKSGGNDAISALKCKCVVEVRGYLPAETRYSTQTVFRVGNSLLVVFGRTGLESWLNWSLNWDSQRLSKRQNGNHETPIVH